MKKFKCQLRERNELDFFPYFFSILFFSCTWYRPCLEASFDDGEKAIETIKGTETMKWMNEVELIFVSGTGVENSSIGEMILDLEQLRSNIKG